MGCLHKLEIMEEELKCFVCSLMDVDTDSVCTIESEEGFMPLCDNCLCIFESLTETGALDCLKQYKEDGDKEGLQESVDAGDGS